MYIIDRLWCPRERPLEKTSKGAKRGLRGFRCIFEKTPLTPVNLPRGSFKGFLSGTSLTVHSVHVLDNYIAILSYVERNESLGYFTLSTELVSSCLLPWYVNVPSSSVKIAILCFEMAVFKRNRRRHYEWWHSHKWFLIWFLWYVELAIFIIHGAKGSFDNYVDKMRLVGGPKMSICVHRVKNVLVKVVRWSKKCKIMPT